jgi:hypothetical protein
MSDIRLSWAEKQSAEIKKRSKYARAYPLASTRVQQDFGMDLRMIAGANTKVTPGIATVRLRQGFRVTGRGVNPEITNDDMHLQCKTGAQTGCRYLRTNADFSKSTIRTKYVQTRKKHLASLLSA